MNENKGIRIWQWAVLLLVLCNIGLIVTIWLKPLHGGPPLPGGGPRNFVIQQLKFTDGQVQKYDALIQAHQQAMHKLRHDANELRQELFANLENENRNNAVIDSITRLIANDQKEIELVTYNHFAQVRALCTDAQKKDFDNIIGDVIKKMNGPGGPPPPRNDGQGPQPGPGNGGPPPDGPPPGDR